MFENGKGREADLIGLNDSIPSANMPKVNAMEGDSEDDGSENERVSSLLRRTPKKADRDTHIGAKSLEK